MKFINFLLIVMLFSICGKNAHAQNCQVLLPSIAGKYTGGCKQGNAEGNGKSVGTDQYLGQFKAGLPDGNGTYTWKSGDVFRGAWVKGLREGPGSMAYKRAGKSDSVINGMWKNDVYAGAYVKPEKPFVLHAKSNYFSRSDFRKSTNSRENSIEISVTNVSGGASRISTVMILPPAEISDINISKGSYALTMDGPETPRGTSKKLVDVVFPFRAVLTIGGQELDFEINDPGAWTITLAINQ